MCSALYLIVSGTLSSSTSISTSIFRHSSDLWENLCNTGVYHLGYNDVKYSALFLLTSSLLYFSYTKLFVIVWAIGLPWWLSGKESACQCRRRRFDPWVGKIPWRRKWQPTPVFFLENSMDWEAWQATVHGVAESRLSLEWLNSNKKFDPQACKLRITDSEQGN